MKQFFIERNFTPASLDTIDRVNEILDDYAGQGYTLSLRQLYYQLVARGYIENTIRSYKRISSVVNDARLAGLVDWDMITDRGRERVSNSHWNSPADILKSAAQSFRIDKWENQEYFVMVMVEKQALEGILIPVCQELDIPFIANKGYSSASSLYEIGQDLRELLDRGKKIEILYLGDHDPSGIDMTRDVKDRIGMFIDMPDSEYYTEVSRLALNMDQIEILRPPENPAKETDSRFAEYRKKYGDSSWELDAVEPAQLAGIVRDAVELYRDEELWEEAISRETTMINELTAMAKQYKKDHGGK